MIKSLGTQIGEDTKSRWSSGKCYKTRVAEGIKSRPKNSGPSCPQCNSRLVKRNNADGRYYDCPRHGFIRDIVSLLPTTVKD